MQRPPPGSRSSTRVSRTSSSSANSCATATPALPYAPTTTTCVVMPKFTTPGGFRGSDRGTGGRVAVTRTGVLTELRFLPLVGVGAVRHSDQRHVVHVGDTLRVGGSVDPDLGGVDARLVGRLGEDALLAVGVPLDSPRLLLDNLVLSSVS